MSEHVEFRHGFLPTTMHPRSGTPIPPGPPRGSVEIQVPRSPTHPNHHVSDMPTTYIDLCQVYPTVYKFLTVSTPNTFGSDLMSFSQELIHDCSQGNWM